MENHSDLLKRIVADPGILGGKPIIRGLRISVEQILRQLAAGISKEQILREFPELEAQDILACLEYAAQSVESEKLFNIHL